MIKTIRRFFAPNPKITHKKTMNLPAEDIARWNRLISMNQDAIAAEGIPMNRKLYSIQMFFGQAMEIYICVYSTQSHVECRAALYFNGSVIDITEARTQLDGEYILHCCGENYVLAVTGQQMEPVLSEHNALKKARRIQDVNTYSDIQGLCPQEEV